MRFNGYLSQLILGVYHHQHAEAASNGFYKSQEWKGTYPKLQNLTIEKLFEGKRIDIPPIGQVNVTFKKVPKTSRDEGSQPELGLGV